MTIISIKQDVIDHTPRQSFGAAFAILKKTKRMRGGEAWQERETRTETRLLRFTKNMWERLIWLRLQVN